MAKPFRVEVAPGRTVAATEYPTAKPDRSGITLILAHGAGAGQTSSFIVSFAKALSERSVAVVTFNFPYMENGGRIPDPTAKLEACYRAVIESVRERHRSKKEKLAIGGKSMGGRIASQVAAGGADDLAGLVFLGYPLHPPARPEQPRATHLPNIKAPMLFVQGSRDAFGAPDELHPIIGRLQAFAELYVVEGGDHSFRVLKSSGLRQAEVYRAIHDKVETWLRAL
jgi:predicted alpha/beta-hydrolase family hydrolase